MHRVVALTLVLIAGFDVGPGRAEQYELEDTVSVVAIDRELVAHAANGRTRKLRLEVGERLRWHGAQDPDPGLAILCDLLIREVWPRAGSRSGTCYNLINKGGVLLLVGAQLFGSKMDCSIT